MKITKLMVSALLALALIPFGCATGYDQGSHSPNIINTDLVTAGYIIADKLVSNANGAINKKDTIIVATMVDINNLEESSTFGRMMSENISSRLAQRGFQVIELKFRRNSVYMEKEKGEFLLSRDLQAVSREHNASAVVVGTYGKSYKSMLVSARIVDPVKGFMVSSCDYTVALGPRTSSVLSRSN
jgi:TolB-like protein